MSRLDNYANGSRAAADAGMLTTLKSCKDAWAEVFQTAGKVTRDAWIVTKVFEELKVEDILNNLGKGFGVDNLGSGAKVGAKGVVLATGLLKEESREKLLQAAKNTAAVVKQGTRTFVEKATPYVKPVIEKSKEFVVKPIERVSSGIRSAWTATKETVGSVAKAVSTGAKKIWGGLKSLFCGW